MAEEHSDEEIEKIGEGAEKELREGKLASIATLIHDLNWSEKKLAASVTNKYDKSLSELTLEELDGVIASLKKKTENEAPPYTLDNIGKQGIEKKHMEEEKKEIEIEWDKIPVQVLIPKLVKALGYSITRLERPEETFLVHREEGKEYVTSLQSCECENWQREGTSINPCKHMCRVRYSDKEIWEKLKELGATEIVPTKEKSRVVPAVSEEIDTTDDMSPALTEIGKIRIGKKEKGIYKEGPKKGQEYTRPTKLKHFKIFTLEKDNEGWGIPDAEMNKRICENCKDKKLENCKELDIYLCYDDHRMNMPRFYAYFTASQVVCIHLIGNGPLARRTKIDGTKEEVICNPKTCKFYQEKKCERYGYLSVILTASNRIGGSYVFRTKSWHTIRNIMSSMMYITARTGGILAGIPLKMRIMPLTVRPVGLGRNTRVYVVNIEYSGTMKQLDDAAMVEVHRRMQMGVNMKQMEDLARNGVTARVIEDAEEEAKEIAEEFESEASGENGG